MSYTPGPWKVAPNYCMNNEYRLWDKDGNYPEDATKATMDDTARLMEAAPALVAALEGWLLDIKLMLREAPHHEVRPRVRELIEEAEQALSLATGQPERTGA